MLSLFSCIGGDPMGLSLIEYGNLGSQFFYKLNLRATQKEHENKSKDISFKLNFNILTFISSSLILIILSFII